VGTEEGAVAAQREEIVSLLKRFQRTPPGSEDHIVLHEEILEKAKRLGREEKKQLQSELERVRTQMVVSRPTYLRPDYYRLVTILLHRLRRRSYADIEREIEDTLSEVEKGIRANHFPRYPSSYVRSIRTLLVEAARSEEADRARLSRLARRCHEVTEAVYSYEYDNVEVEVTSTRIKVSSLFTLGESQRSYVLEFISPELEYGGRTFLKREVLAYMARVGRPLSRGEIERGIDRKIPYFGHIIESLLKKYMVVPVPGENRYELTGTGRKVGEVYIHLLERMSARLKRPGSAKRLARGSSTSIPQIAE